ncbi:F-box protein At2g26160-like [Silene latifolia]|uniref:F-box protein At2g26160-like n=1 Tax=Silene latifolia TaxID=37657 RepID=UPI003D783757
MKSTKALTTSSSSFEPDWAWLPRNLLFMVLNKLFLLSDMIRFASVCSHWRFVAKDRFEQLNLHGNMHFTRNIPMLLIPAIENDSPIHNLFSITRGEIYDLRLPVPYTKRYIGSSHGWLIILDEVSFVVTLINPFYFGNSQGIIHLPPFIAALDTSEEEGQDFNCEYFVRKAILSSDPATSPNDYVLMLIYGEFQLLASWKSGDTHWTYVNWEVPLIYDLMYSHGQILAVDILGQLISCDIRVKPASHSIVSDHLLGMLGTFCRRYIVKLPDGTILQTVRLLRACKCNKDVPAFFTIGFVLYKLLDNNDRKKWISVESLGEGALFVGDNHSQYVITSNFPGCAPNSVYFTDYYEDADSKRLNSYHFTAHRYIGVCHLDDGIIRRIFYLVEKICLDSCFVTYLVTVNAYPSGFT